MWKGGIKPLCLLCMLSVGWSVKSSPNPQTNHTTVEDSVYGKNQHLRDMEVRGYRIPESATSTAPLQTLTKTEIKDLGIQNVADATRRFAGVTVRDYGGIGGLKTVSVRNLGASHTVVGYDDVIVNNTQAGQVDIGRFSIENIESLSLSIGQSNDMLSSARACAAAALLNIVSEKPSFGNRKNIFKGSIQGGSFGYFGNHLSWSHRLADSTAFLLQGNIIHAEGDYPFTLVNGRYTSTERRINSDVNSRHGEATLLHTFQNGGDFHLKLYHDYSKRGLPGIVTLYNPESQERLFDEDFFVQTTYKQVLSDKWQWTARAKYTFSENQYKDYGVEYQNGETTDYYKQNEYYASATVCRMIDRHLSLSLAQDAAINTLWSNLQDCPFPTRYTSLTALRMQYKHRMVQSDFTLVHTFMSDEVENGEKPEDKKRWSPTLSMSVKPFAEETFYIRAFWKNTFRVPTFNDLYYFRMGNRSVRPEKATEYNLGITWNEQQWPLLHYLTLTLDGYYNVVSDKIVAFPSTYVWRMVNYGKVHIHGLDITMATEFPIHRQIKVAIHAACTFQKATDVTPESVTYGSQLVYTPRQSGNASILFSTPWINLGYSLIGVGERYFMAQNIQENLIEGYLEHSLTASHTFKWEKSSLRLQAEIVNLSNESYEVIKYYPMPGRAFRLSADLFF